ncbi:Glucoamylase (glucan-1,4-alpha-glucosidase), GH15 family [Micromonospora nigra]|uniref:Glucoamylase (Glucan-1,4-alpha-glucosidase), GH15 family n=1 Tax=Micromonospora nigra TaxID=145857 RepID=A0A1C6T099_9ACTN|nr:glycoside hydrolase family 15 protein [Micromonospora nigra]SCL34765.1 Glucoamylase (glucan-1,4-alpha-glucosidase), GH15 family [Micromonospora nigra]
MESYPPVEAHGFIGDLQTAALISKDGVLDWFCAPRFDSPSIFAALLDRRGGGHFRIAPDGTEYVSKQLYLPGTPILITRFLSVDGVGELIDFMPLAGTEPTGRHRVIRMLKVVRGTMRFRVECRPRFNYGRDEHVLERRPEGHLFRAPGMTMSLSPVQPGDRQVREEKLDLDGNAVHALITLSVGDTGGLVLETEPEGEPRVFRPAEIELEFDRTREFWRQWLDRSRYTGRWREMVERSAITLKLMTYAPTGALIAAPTAGLPELIGGERNWDYRYTWLRDASFSVHALLYLGYTEEAAHYLEWVGDRIREATEGHVPLQLLYRVDGSPHVGEEILPHFEGYRGSYPVRIGNHAASQLQLDVYGEALEALFLADAAGLGVSRDVWRDIARLMNWLCRNWDTPDDGIWETRGGRRRFTYSRLMSWVALDRALRVAAHEGKPADLLRWTTARDAIYEQVMDRGYNRHRHAFVQHYDTEVLDASLLSMPSFGFIAASDPMWQSTMRAIQDELVSDSLVYRYDPAASPDGLPGAEGTFTMCSFWYVEALAQVGRVDEARLVFEKLFTYSTSLGLFSEEIAPTGEQIGNFPQAFSHLSLISTAIRLDGLLNNPRSAAPPPGRR